MEITINDIHIVINKNKNVYQVFPNRSIFPVDMEFRGELGWQFISDETPEYLKAIQTQISDFIKEN